MTSAPEFPVDIDRIRMHYDRLSFLYRHFWGEHLRWIGPVACRQTDLYQTAATADPNNAPAAKDLATAFSAMSDMLDLSGKSRDALEWERKARPLYQTLETKDPDSLETATNNASSLLHFGSLEAKLKQPIAAERDLQTARAMLQHQAKEGPKDHIVEDLYRCTETALAANHSTGETRGYEFPRQPGK